MSPTDARGPSPTIVEALDQFPEEARGRLSPGTFEQYRRIVRLWTACLNNYGAMDLNVQDRARFEALYRDRGESHREFCQAFGADRILENDGQFLGYFMMDKVVASQQTRRAAVTVTRKLAAWLEEKGYASADAGRRTRDYASMMAEEILAAEGPSWWRW